MTQPITTETRIYIPFFKWRGKVQTVETDVITSVKQLFTDVDYGVLEDCIQVMCIEGVNRAYDATEECATYFWENVACKLSERGAPFPAFIAADGVSASADYLSVLCRGAAETASHQSGWFGR